MRTVQKIFPLLHKVVLHYKIVPACNTWHNPAVSGVIKQLETLKPVFCFSALKVQIFAALFRYSTLLTKGREKWKFGNLRETRETIICFVYQCQVLSLRLQEKNALSVAATKACIVTEIESAFSFPQAHSEFEHCSFISSYNSNETSFGRWWNWKAAELQEIWSGTVQSRVLQGVEYKGAIS
jgi:hypothetical protein